MSSSQESVEGRHWGNLEVSTLSSSLKSRVQVASSRYGLCDTVMISFCSKLLFAKGIVLF